MNWQNISTARDRKPRQILSKFWLSDHKLAIEATKRKQNMWSLFDR